MIYPDNYEEKIGFQRIRALLKNLCLSSLGKLRADEMSFSDSFEYVDYLTKLTHEMRNVCLMYSNFPTNNYHDLTSMLEKIKTEGAFPAVENVFALLKSLETIAAISLFFSNKSEIFPLLSRLSSKQKRFNHIITEIDKLLDNNGSLRDNASKELASIRARIVEKQATVARTIQRILKHAQNEGFAEKGSTPSIRDGRVVIPINSSFKRKINGIVHDESATGRTSYIEPAEIVITNNAIRELFFAQEREIIRILVEFADFLRPHIEELLSAFDFLGDIDFVRAKALLALKMDAVKPIFQKQQAFHWYKAVHPIMYLNFKKENKELVPLDIYLTEKERILLISGPNAGGKSVCLKTVGLIQYMFQCGLLVPMSENSEIGIFKTICIDIGDNQSIDNDLSTYSSHLHNMKQFVRLSTPRTLILIDEFGAGTEPIIGGAIAEAILEKLNKRGVYGVITTHYSNLKYYAGRNKMIVNGAMDYDNHNMQPLFRLQIGVPGSSFAFEIAQKIGLPEDILAQAADKAGHQHIDFDKQLSNIDNDKRYWEKKRKELERREKHLSEISAKQLSELEEIQQERKTIIDDAHREAKKILSTTNQIIENTIRKIKENQADKEITKEARHELDEFKKRGFNITGEEHDRILRKIEKLKERERQKQEKQQAQNIQQEQFKEQNVSETQVEEVQICKGDFVKIDGQDAVGEVVRIKGKNIIVSFGNMINATTKDKLTKVSQKNPAKLSQNNSSASAHVYDVGQRRLRFQPQIDIRGMRAYDVMQCVEDLLDEAAMLNIGQVRILHGTGYGVLRQIVRHLLKASPIVKSYTDEDIRQGGTGITIVNLR